VTKTMSFGKDVTTGSIPKHLLQLALPILIGNLLATGYSIINTFWVGNLLGKEAVGAVAVSFPIFLGMIALCSGATLASSILVSRAYGAKDSAIIQRIVNTSWTLAIAIILIVTAGGWLLSEEMLKLLGTAEEILPLATDYLRITFLGFAGLYLSYLIASLLRGIGDTKVPLLFIILSTALNALLDPLMIKGFGFIPSMGLQGAALASLLSSGVATVLGAIYVKRKYKQEPMHPTALRFEKSMMMDMVKIGLPSFVQQMLVSMGYAFIVLFVNLFSSAAIAAFGIASRLDSIVAMPAIAMMMAVSTLTAQSFGAGKPERIKGIFTWGIVMNIPVILIISVLCFSFPEVIMRIFVSDTEVVEAGIEYLRVVGAGYLFFIVFYVSNGIINGSGKTVSTMVITFLSLCAVRIPLAGWLSHTSLGIRGVWIAVVCSFAMTTLCSLLYYYSGRWNKSGKEAPQSIQRTEGRVAAK
jgi:putative MATE family efflux protein